MLNIRSICEKVTDLQMKIAEIHKDPKTAELDDSIVLKDGCFDYTTGVDIGIEEFEKVELMKLIPGSGVLGEETQEIDGVIKWVVDPTDGTAVWKTGGEYYSNSVALMDMQESKIVFGSVFQSVTGRQFINMPGELIVRELITDLDGNIRYIERRPRGTSSKGFGEYLGCSFGTSKYYTQYPDVKPRLEAVFGEQEVPELKRKYAAKNARPMSGSSALYCCDIVDGNRHFAMLFFQKAWDLAVGAMYAKQAGCPVVIFDNDGNAVEKDLEQEIIKCDKDSVINVGVFANNHVKEYVLNKFYG